MTSGHLLLLTYLIFIGRTYIFAKTEVQRHDSLAAIC